MHQFNFEFDTGRLLFRSLCLLGMFRYQYSDLYPAWECGITINRHYVRYEDMPR